MIRVFSALLLSLVLALTSHSTAGAKGAPTAVDHMVICTGFGATVVYTDAHGQPTSAPHLCPDCVMHLGAGLLPDTDLAAAVLTTTARRALPLAEVPARPGRALARWARGPPDVI